MNDLIDLAFEVKCDLQNLKAFIQWESQRLSECLAEGWIDSQRVMIVLKIKKRALQKLRDKGLLPFSAINGKLYYKTTDLEKMLKANYRKRRRGKKVNSE